MAVFKATVAEIENSFKKYWDLAMEGHRILITKDGQVVGKLVNMEPATNSEVEYKYKAVIEFDDEKLRADHYDVEDAYRIVKKMFAEKEIKDISEGKHLVFVTDTGKGWSGMSACFVVLWQGWARPYLKVMDYYDMKKP